jgi:prolipoprotein diacylglyceryltransferase
VTLGAKPRAAREPAGHTAAAAANGALVICLLRIRDHAIEYMQKISGAVIQVFLIVFSFGRAHCEPGVRRAHTHLCLLA